MAENEFASDLHPKHIQALKSALDRLDWLVRTWDETVLLGDPPSHLTSARNSVREVLVESGELDTTPGIDEETENDE